MSHRDLIAALPRCTEILRRSGKDRYALDCLVRHLRGVGDDQVWPRAIALGLDAGADVIEISAGIGHLRATPHLTTWSPTVAGTPPPTRLAAAEDLRVVREQICVTCTSHRNGRCTLGCSCAGLGDPSAQHSRCPIGLWPGVSITS